MAPVTSQGTLLKSTRESRGISLGVVHEATKIPMDVLRAIEEGYTVRTLTPFYLKGFIKMYAEYLKINVQDVLADYKQPEQKAVPSILPKIKPAPVAPAAPAETLDLEQWLAGVFTHRRKQQIVILAAAFLSFFVLFKIITFFTQQRPKPVVKEAKKEEKKKEKPVVVKSVAVAPSPVEKKPPVITAKAPEKVAVVTPSPKPTVPAAVPFQAAAPTQQLDKEIMLTVRAKKDTWLRVAADGVTVFQSALNHGKSETWLAQERIEISGKNMQQLEFELNGKLIGMTSRRDTKAKKIVITREGLSVVP